MEEQAGPPIFDIIWNYDQQRLENRLAHGNIQDLLARNDQGVHPIEFACPYIQSLCLNALGDQTLLIEVLTKTLELSYLPEDLRTQIQQIYDAVIALWNATDMNLVPSLQELSMIELCAGLGVNGCTPATIAHLTGGDTGLSALSGRVLMLIAIIAMEYRRQGAWPNPLAAFAFLALLDMGDEFAWLAEVYHGSAEIAEESSDD